MRPSDNYKFFSEISISWNDWWELNGQIDDNSKQRSKIQILPSMVILLITNPRLIVAPALKARHTGFPLLEEIKL